MKNQVKEPMMETKEKVNQKAQAKQKPEEKKESSFTAENAIMVLGITATAVATGAAVFFYATAGIGVSAAIVLAMLDGATIILMGALSTTLAVYAVKILKSIFSKEGQDFIAEVSSAI